MTLSGNQQSSRKRAAEARAAELISAAMNDPSTLVQTSELYDIIDVLPPLTTEELLGEWSGSAFNTGHPVYYWLKSINWMGITFRSDDDVEPLVVAVQTRDGSGTRRRWLDEWGNGQVDHPFTNMH